MLALDAVYRSCGLPREFGSWMSELPAGGPRVLRTGVPRTATSLAGVFQTGTEPPLTRADFEVHDLVAGLVQGSAFSSACCARLLARWVIRERTIVSAEVIPLSTPGVGSWKHELYGHTTCPHCGAVTSARHAGHPAPC
ncbi:MAG: hypothetical protein ACRDHX_16795 [Chloroflexota bacterium]